MADKLPKLDRAGLRERLLVEFERVVEEVSNAIDDAPVGRVIRDSEEKARDTLDRFRQIVKRMPKRPGEACSAKSQRTARTG